ncbi:hypothetical protein PLIIFM63780_008876 [Purpureocillium lilacinum]|uniref:RNase III domain-containing protein n=1 Tax=Purpureocillium lilacinum TaxID=33203 RepID=A0A2U3E8H7_PURLI|nr:hypothetical protein Purlil1_5082 [Purpureocillium lilacinum]PWI70821.1 hypothetical protein PCL_12189 [Purpureocillium lilacinum]GJN74956.1 hypothetical protein PLICBS_009050 [Purpureocillium lilacinum]GJN85310.1 hypothetical protein PLIIFM63780_008876 [Purpureocillium lilacinum]
MAALQPCRAGLARSRLALRSLHSSSLRAGYATTTDSTTSSSSSSSSSATSAPSNAIPESFRAPSDTAAAGSGAPRWSQTPAGMKAPVQMDFARSARNKAWTVNSSPERLDEMYERLLGPGGSKMLPEELKWLAVTHKSFDQGRRGFNDRLALMGRLTLIMEATKDIVSRPPQAGTAAPAAADPHGREPFAHEALAGVDNLSATTPREAVGKERLHALAASVGMLDVVRWKPRLPRRLEASGVETVLGGALMAVVGAVTLQHGAKVASKVVRERILARLPKEE